MRKGKLCSQHSCERHNHKVSGDTQGQSERKIGRASSYESAPLSESPVHQRCVLSHTRVMQSLQNATLLTFQDEQHNSVANTLEKTGKCA